MFVPTAKKYFCKVSKHLYFQTIKNFIVYACKTEFSNNLFCKHITHNSPVKQIKINIFFKYSQPLK